MNLPPLAGLVLLSSVVAGSGCSGISSAQAGLPAKMDRQADGLVVHLAAGDLRLQVVSESVIRVVSASMAAPGARASLMTVPRQPMTSGWKVSEEPGRFALSTAKLRVSIDRASGAVSFADHAGRTILQEANGGRVLQPSTVQGESTFHVQQRWNAQEDESLYGLGQMQLGTVDIKGFDLELWQHNTNVVVPLLVSSKGYGVLWDNTSFTRFGDLRPFEAIPADNLLDANGKPGGLSNAPVDGSEAVRQVAEISVKQPLTPEQIDHPETASGSWRLERQYWEGYVLPPATGDYQLQAYSNGGIKVWLDGRMVMDHWRQNWLSSDDQVRVRLEAGHRVKLRIENDPEQQNTLRLLWKTPSADRGTSLWSQVGDGVDYYFIYGPATDNVISGYRMLTGRATMLPSWTFGLWQSRQRYETAAESLDVVKEFRSRGIPFDAIVQDWQYWRPDAWGSHEFDSTRFPDPEGWIKSLHDLHAHLMLSVWGKFNPKTENAQIMNAKGFLYQPNLQEKINDWIRQPYTFYDAFNPEARKLFWQQLNTRLFQKGVDAWWMDATEPDLLPSPPTLEGQQTHMNPTFLGTGSRMLNGYALENSKGVYEGQRAAAPDQRVFILTRSGFAGEQRYSAVTWSGDTTSTWTAMRKQIPAGLGASISGLPYWTMDTGGYTMQRRFAQKQMTPEAEEEWRELNARWFELSTFTPILRVHGELRPREIWTLGENSPAYNAELQFDRLRYAMLPYLLAQAGWVTQHDYTMMRPLVMDFPQDRAARELTDEYMFGPALLVAPITQYKQRTRAVYLPAGTTWYDLWTGKRVAAGSVLADAPFDQIPVFVRAGSVLPLGPALQYVGEKAADPLTLLVYGGADGSFNLYEDQGNTFEYERGAFSNIPMVWNERSKVLTIGKRTGTFAGMPERRTFQTVVISGAHAVGYSSSLARATTVQYDGREVRVSLR